jgi:predicted nucleotidyltransferase/DNA-binding XRE family transcriptional regulator
MFPAHLIVEARLSCGITQSELAARAGTSQPTLSRYEIGEAIPTLATLERLMAACGKKLGLMVEDSPRHLDVRAGLMHTVHVSRKQIVETLLSFDMHNPAVFGSVARGEEHEGSDIDIMVDFDVNIKGLGPIMKATDKLEGLLHQQIDLVPRAALAEHVFLQAQREAVPL